MKVIKRNEMIVDFDRNKIKEAILKAMEFGSGNIKEGIANNITLEIEEEFEKQNKILISINEIETLLYEKLIKKGHKFTARAYENYKATRENQRKQNTIDNKVLKIIKGNASDIKDNSNKNPVLISTMRDLIAEEVSKDLSLRMKLPTHITQAHNDGLIYIHDLGHYLNPSFNCCLANLRDMLENGTVINGKMIEKPKSFRTACTIATQLITQISSGQFGGQTISLAHLSPFVRISKENLIKDVTREYLYISNKKEDTLEDKDIQFINEIATERLKKEIKDGIQTFQYQLNTMMSSNGQAPFLSVFMYISEYPEYEEETVMLIEEMLNQRITGMKNEVGVYISPAFPKLLYVTDENNIHPNSKYYHLTELSAKCVAKRMMPDFLSAKILKENYEGNIVPPMGKRILSPCKTLLTCCLQGVH